MLPLPNKLSWTSSEMQDALGSTRIGKGPQRDWAQTVTTQRHNVNNPCVEGRTHLAHFLSTWMRIGDDTSSTAQPTGKGYGACRQAHTCPKLAQRRAGLFQTSLHKTSLSRRRPLRRRQQNFAARHNPQLPATKSSNTSAKPRNKRARLLHASWR